MGIALAVVVIGIAIVVVAVLAFMRRDSRDEAEAAAVVAGAPLVFDDEGEAHIVPRDPEITWPKQFGLASADLDADARLRLINDLALLRASWCVPILQQAYEEEQDPAHRRAIVDALAACDPDSMPATLEPKR